jgi:hypothetical protein
MIKTILQPVKPHSNKVPVNLMTENQLNWAVATALGMPVYPSKRGTWLTAPYGRFDASHKLPHWRPAYDWSQGGPIIEDAGIMLVRYTAIPAFKCGEYYWKANDMDGATPLIAAMRCFVASKLGDQIELPEGVL